MAQAFDIRLDSFKARSVANPDAAVSKANLNE